MLATGAYKWGEINRTDKAVFFGHLTASALFELLIRTMGSATCQQQLGSLYSTRVFQVVPAGRETRRKTLHI